MWVGPVCVCACLCLGGVALGCSFEREPLLPGLPRADVPVVVPDSAPVDDPMSGAAASAAEPSPPRDAGAGPADPPVLDPIDAGPMAVDAALPVFDAELGPPTVAGSCTGFVPQLGECPAECTSCEGERCVIECAIGTCSGQDIRCPPGFVCEVSCGGFIGCANSRVECADGPCSVECSNGFACANLELRCGPDACRLSCGAGGNSNAEVQQASSCAAEIACGTVTD